MQTRYDTHRIEGGWLADVMSRRLEQLQGELDTARRYYLPVSRDRSVCEGSLVAVRMGGDIGIYLILPFAGGAEVTQGDDAVMVITPDSPLAQELWGKKAGQTTTFRRAQLEIVDAA